jgi:16S rRNA (uracil1498-N3)-methyltransferase
MILFFDLNISEKTEQFVFNRDESKHLAKVLRKNIAETITVTNGKGLEWTGILSQVTVQKSIANRTAVKQHKPQENKIHLAIAPTKNNNRMEWLIEKITELGISSITPILCDHSERKVLKKERFEKIAVAAMKQSLQFFMPQINDLINFNDFIKTIESSSFIAYCKNKSKGLLSQSKLDSNSITLLIGPEGDFSLKEIEVAIKNKIKPISLGNQRFRTETAGLLACHTVFLKQLQKSNL